MNRSVQILLLVALTLLTACAPIVYEPVPQSYYSPSVDYYGYPDTYTYDPIEVSFYTGIGAYLQTIVIHDHEYIYIPIRTREGRVSHVFAHYHQGDFHFDSNRYCNNIKGTPRFRYDKSWERGHRYEQASNRDDFFGGLSVAIRNKNIQNRGAGFSRNQTSVAREGRQLKTDRNNQWLQSSTQAAGVYSETSQHPKIGSQRSSSTLVSTDRQAVQAKKAPKMGGAKNTFIVDTIVNDKSVGTNNKTKSNQGHRDGHSNAVVINPQQVKKISQSANDNTPLGRNSEMIGPHNRSSFMGAVVKAIKVKKTSKLGRSNEASTATGGTGNESVGKTKLRNGNQKINGDNSRSVADRRGVQKKKKDTRKADDDLIAQTDE